MYTIHVIACLCSQGVENQGKAVLFKWYISLRVLQVQTALDLRWMHLCELKVLTVNVVFMLC